MKKPLQGIYPPVWLPGSLFLLAGMAIAAIAAAGSKRADTNVVP